MNDKSSLGDPWLAGLEAVRRDSGWFSVLGILLMVLGVMALAAAGLMTLGTMVFFGCLLIVGGVMQLINAFKVREWGGFFFDILLLIGTLETAPKFYLLQWGMKPSAPRSATMEWMENPHACMRQALSPWGVASGGCKPEVKELPCATRRIDGMRGNLLDLYRQVVSPWAVAP